RRLHGRAPRRAVPHTARPRRLLSRGRRASRAYFGPFDAARNSPSWLSFCWPRAANFGITLLPCLDGSATYVAKKLGGCPPLPIDDRSGAPRFELPVPR